MGDMNPFNGGGGILGSGGMTDLGGGINNGLNGILGNKPNTPFALAMANMQMPTTNAEANTAYNQTQTGLQQQQDFLSALQAQNGIGNQSSVYGQLQGIANGTGPNPAQAMLAQSTGQNTANQAALMAGQRGAGANTGLIARQAGMQGGANQQAAAGQGAVMQANQSMNALNQMGGMAGQQVAQQAAATTGYSQAAQSQQQNLLNAIAQQNQGIVSSTNAGNADNAQINMANNTRNQGVLGSMVGGLGSALAMSKGGEVPAQNLAMGGAPMTPTTTESDFSSSPSLGHYLFGSAPSSGTAASFDLSTPQVSAPGGSSSGGMSKFLPSFMNAKKQQADAQAKQRQDSLNKIGSPAPSISTNPYGPQNNPDLTPGDVPANSVSDMSYGPAADTGVDAGMDFGLAKGGKVPAMVSPGEIYLRPDQAKNVASNRSNPMEGERIPGKAKVKGDSLKNDTVPKTLESGGVVIPRSIVEAPDAAKKAAAFVAAHLAKSGRMPKKPKS